MNLEIDKYGYEEQGEDMEGAVVWVTRDWGLRQVEEGGSLSVGGAGKVGEGPPSPRHP